MTQEEKELLLKDLCARLPYHVRVKVWLEDGDTEEGPLNLQHNDGDILLDAFFYKKIKKIKPYLRPMSSMKRNEIANAIKYIFNTDKIVYTSADEGIGFYAVLKNKIRIKVDEFQIKLGKYGINNIDWLNKYHFDYRSLIEKGLAIEAPEGMYVTK